MSASLATNTTHRSIKAHQGKNSIRTCLIQSLILASKTWARQLMPSCSCTQSAQQGLIPFGSSLLIHSLLMTLLWWAEISILTRSAAPVRNNISARDPDVSDPNSTAPVIPFDLLKGGTSDGCRLSKPSTCNTNLKMPRAFHDDPQVGTHCRLHALIGKRIMTFQSILSTLIEPVNTLAL